MNARIKTAWADSSRRRVVRTVWKSSRPLSLALLAWALASAAVPALTIVAMGRLVGDVPAAVAHGLGSPAGHRLSAQLALFAVLFAFNLTLSPIQTGLSMIVRVRLTYDMQDELTALVNEPVGIEHLEDPDLLDRIARAQGELTSLYAADAPMTFAQVISVRLGGLLACSVIASFRWWMGLALIVFWLGLRRVIRKIPKAQVEAYLGSSAIMRRAGYFNDLATKPAAAKELRVFGLGTWIVDELRRHWEDGMAAGWRQHRRYYTELPPFALAAIVLYGALCAYLAHAAVVGAATLTSVATVLVMLSRTFQVGSVSTVDHMLEWQAASLPALDSLQGDVERRVRATTGNAPSDGLPRRSIAFEGVRFGYPGAPQPVLDGLDLIIPAGRSTAIVGVNGAGKTTIVKLLARLHEPTGGRLLVDGQDLASFEPHAWQQRIAVVFQDFNEYPVSAYDNVVLGAHRFVSDRAGFERAASRAGALDLINDLPEGGSTLLSSELEAGRDLSGGQWQRVALARALFAAEHGATVLVLDEPTAWLDVRGEAAFYERFLDITRGLTTVVISHRFSTVRLAAHICVLEQGRLVERGSHDELLASGGRYAEMFRLQASRFVDDPEDGAA